MTYMTHKLNFKLLLVSKLICLLTALLLLAISFASPLLASSNDTDTDGDGVDNINDVFPLDPLEWADADGDGIGDNSDTEFNSPSNFTSVISTAYNTPFAVNASTLTGNGISISDGGRFTVFTSFSSEIMENDDNNAADVFVYDRITNQKELISVSSDSVIGNGPSADAAISANGRYVAFSSSATNFVTLENPGYSNIFLRDRLLRTTELIAEDASRPAISANGDVIVFDSDSLDLVASDISTVQDIFVFERNTGSTSLVTVSSSGNQSTSAEYSSSISRDGRFVVFSTFATNLIDNVTLPIVRQVYVRDLLLQTTKLVSVNSAGDEGNANAQSIAHISGNNEFILFSSRATNLVPNSNFQSGRFQLFIYERATGAMEIVSTAGNGLFDTNSNYSRGISSDGRYVTFDSSTFLANGNFSRSDTYIQDRETDSLILINATDSGEISDTRPGASPYGGINGNMDVTGAFVAFQSNASNIDSNYVISDLFEYSSNVYLYNREAAGGDLDGDTIADGLDMDDDGDGVDDLVDAFPLDATESLDSDGDGIGNNSSTDDDGDGVLDTEDAFPLDPNESVDTDGDGAGNNADTDDDNDGVLDTDDAFPLDSNESLDSDGDGIGNNSSTDDDGDGVLDTEDAFPLDATESVDTDGDGTGNNADSDDDNDSVNDAADTFPLDANESSDNDQDGIGDNADNDDDNDGVNDQQDRFPFDDSEYLDTDADGTGDNSDNDDDGDGMPDQWEIDNGLDPKDSTDAEADRDGDGISNLTEYNNSLNEEELLSESSGGGSISYYFLLLVLSGLILRTLFSGRRLSL